MDVEFVFYKELPLFDENIFFANLAENNEIEEIRLKKDNQHLITGLKVNLKNANGIIEIKKEIDDVTTAKIDVLSEKAKCKCKIF